MQIDLTAIDIFWLGRDFGTHFGRICRLMALALLSPSWEVLGLILAKTNSFSCVKRRVEKVIKVLTCALIKYFSGEEQLDLWGIVG